MPNDSEDYIGGRVEVGDSFTGRGDIDNYDLTQATMTMDGAFHDWDISGIVPAGTTMVLVGARIADTTVGRFVYVQYKGFLEGVNTSLLVNAVTNKTAYNEFIVPVDPDVLKLEYMTYPAAIDVISFYIKGWWT